MPIFCYRCKTCGFYFENLVRSENDEPQDCPKCPGKVKKEFAPFAIGKGSSPSSRRSSCAGCGAGSCRSCHK
ncbi:MAG: FmdB family zinc ribbon protein [Candidatus Omnitrophota bacterium]